MHSTWYQNPIAPLVTALIRSPSALLSCIALGRLPMVFGSKSARENKSARGKKEDGNEVAVDREIGEDRWRNKASSYTMKSDANPGVDDFGSVD